MGPVGIVGGVLGFFVVALLAVCLALVLWLTCVIRVSNRLCIHLQNVLVVASMLVK